MFIESLESRICLSHVAPYGLVANTLGTGIKLTWRDDTRTSSFTIQRSFNGGKWHNYAKTRAHSFLDLVTSLPGHYAYRVFAGNSIKPSNTVVQTLTDFRAMAILDAGRYGVQLQWSESDPTVIGYQIERSSDGGSTWKMIASPSNTQQFYFDFPVPDGVTLTYQIAEVR